MSLKVSLIVKVTKESDKRNLWMSSEDDDLISRRKEKKEREKSLGAQNIIDNWYQGACMGQSKHCNYL